MTLAAMMFKELQCNALDYVALREEEFLLREEIQRTERRVELLKRLLALEIR